MNRGITVFGPEMHCIFDAAVCGQDAEFVPDLERPQKKFKFGQGRKEKESPFFPGNI